MAAIKSGLTRSLSPLMTVIKGDKANGPVLIKFPCRSSDRPSSRRRWVEKYESFSNMHNYVGMKNNSFINSSSSVTGFSFSYHESYITRFIFRTVSVDCFEYGPMSGKVPFPCYIRFKTIFFPANQTFDKTPQGIVHWSQIRWWRTRY